MKPLSYYKEQVVKFLSHKPKKKNDSFSMIDSGFDDNYLFDFKSQFSSGFTQNFGGGTIMINNGNDNVEVDGVKSSAKSQKIKIKPIDVLAELETTPTPFSLSLIDEKLSILEDKRKLIKQHYTLREIDGLIERLTNRKQYLRHKVFFDRFQSTTEEAIDKLLDKYELAMKESDIFIPEFPDDAVKVMKEYSTVVKKICKKKPIFYVIAEDKDFKKAYEKRDPILLVQSPFGFYYHILGAWDKEMLLLSSL